MTKPKFIYQEIRDFVKGIPSGWTNVEEPVKEGQRVPLVPPGQLRAPWSRVFAYYFPSLIIILTAYLVGLAISALVFKDTVGMTLYRAAVAPSFWTSEWILAFPALAVAAQWARTRKMTKQTRYLMIVILFLVLTRSLNVAQVIHNNYSTPAKAILHNDFKALSVLLSEGADPNTMDDYGNPILNGAVELSSRIKFVELLLEHGADPNVKNKYGDTMLNTAVYSGNPETVNLLLKYGADPTVPGDSGTPLSLAKRLSKGDIVAILATAVNGATSTPVSSATETRP